jgi:predicted chitinase
MTSLPPITTVALSSLDSSSLRRIQQLLLQAGFPPGKLDGLYGPNTLAAWAAFKKSVHLDAVQLIDKIGRGSYDKLIKKAQENKNKEHDFSTKTGTILAIKWECNQHGLTLPTQQAYVLATVEHETARTFRPLEEYGKGKGRTYGKPDPQTGKTYYGRGFVQLTWKSNYRKYSEILGIDLVNRPELACNANVALFILVHGFRHGTFTGKSLPQYVNNRQTDFYNARRVINGIDQANHIANLAQKYL